MSASPHPIVEEWLLGILRGGFFGRNEIRQGRGVPRHARYLFYVRPGRHFEGHRLDFGANALRLAADVVQSPRQGVDAVDVGWVHGRTCYANPVLSTNRRPPTRAGGSARWQALVPGLLLRTNGSYN